MCNSTSSSSLNPGLARLACSGTLTRIPREPSNHQQQLFRPPPPPPPHADAPRSSQAPYCPVRLTFPMRIAADILSGRKARIRPLSVRLSAVLLQIADIKAKPALVP
ncbi:hypothetical protein S40285_10263 [Stachybotrys chlorohalonatus IBT 40285]|uniref:Uncharacterized protein n=1 Tax=Stachybotrys chlorohalonatus (strain IBT 40285) TaxID=1283841 RepID=A0A084QRY2_STAC4|nr:hypothetical protein S40285_10263 [Stachybotrys chlorohalonata IBT 40285]